MAVTRSLATGEKNGRVGSTSYYTSEGRQLSRAAQNISNYGSTARRTYKQQLWRVKWGNLVVFYRCSQQWMRCAFEGRKAGVSDYNKFMSLNVRTTPYYLTKAQVEAGGCVAGDYLVAQGSMYPITPTLDGSTLRSSVATSYDGDLSALTITELSSDILSLNSWLEEYNQISLICYRQYKDGNGVPRVLCTKHELTLNTKSTSLVGDYFPESVVFADGGFLCAGPDLTPGAYAWVLSNTAGGTTTTSTQTLVSVNNEAIQAEFSSYTQLAAAINSYGIDEEYFLESGSVESTTTEVPATIIDIATFNDEWNGQSLLSFATSPSMQITVQFSRNVEAIQKVRIYFADGSYTNAYFEITSFDTYGNNGYIQSLTATSYTNITNYGTHDTLPNPANVWRILFYLADGTTIAYGASSAVGAGYDPDSTSGDPGE